LLLTVVAFFAPCTNILTYLLTYLISPPGPASRGRHRAYYYLFIKVATA